MNIRHKQTLQNYPFMVTIKHAQSGNPENTRILRCAGFRCPPGLPRLYISIDQTDYYLLLKMIVGSHSFHSAIIPFHFNNGVLILVALIA